MVNLFDQVKSLIDRHQLLPDGCVVIAGVSGGPDSMALLSILNIMKSLSDFELHAAHVNHGLRVNAANETNLVRQWCRQNGINLFEKEVKLKEIARARGRSLEEAGREVRREFFLECVNRLRHQHGKETGIRIALAHHMQDQAETMILNLGRGSGLDGLAGMRVADLPFIRPLLYSDPAAIRNWLDDTNVPWLMDESNDELSFTRNRVRHLLLPVWQELLGYNPVPLLSRAAENLDYDRSFLNQAGNQAFEHSVRRTENGDIIGLDCNFLTQQPEAVRFRVMRRFYAEAAGTARDFSKIHADLMQQVLLDASGPFDLPAGLIVTRTGDLLKVIPGDAQLAAKIDFENWETKLQVPGDTMLPEKFGFIRAEMIEYRSDFRYNSQMNCFSRQALTDCVVRFRRPGDRIRPVGRSGSRTLKKFMNEQKVPVSDRWQLPLVASGPEIVWLPGYGCGQRFCLTGGKADRLAAAQTPISDSGQNAAVRLVWLRPDDNNHDSVTEGTSF
jgi:tRNA(Ile)-lysidine synthase